MSRRQFGKVRVLASGRYQARYKGPDGRERAAPRTFETAAGAGAEQFLALMDGEMASGEWIDPLLGLVPFGDYALNWLEVRTEPLSPRTQELYRQLLRTHILPTWGAVPINRIAPSGVRRWYADLLTEGRSRGVAAKSYRLMRAVLNTAVDD
jgi:Phage integrase, N-terminal SAM-like domain